MIDYKEAYAQAIYIRMAEEAIAKEYPNGQMKCPVHFSIGQETVSVNVSMAMPDSKAYASHRSHAPYLAFGGSLEKLVAELYGLPDGCTGGYGGSMYLYDDDQPRFGGSFAVVGDSVAVATGAALAFRQKGLDTKAVVFMGDSVVETGQFWESVNFACTHRLPIIYVCENNLYATQSYIMERQPDQEITSRLEGFWNFMSIESCDDRLGDVYYAAKRAYESDAPAFMEVKTYRHLEHVGPNDDSDMGYRPPAEVALFKEFDPVAALRSMLGDTEARAIEERHAEYINEVMRDTRERYEEKVEYALS